MFGRERTATPAAPDPRPSPQRTVAIRQVTPAILVCLVAGAIALFYLGLYPAKRYALPIGWDTPRYLAQASFVAERGLDGVPERLPPPSKTLPGRPGFPVIVLSLSGLFGQSTFRAAAVVPVVGAVALALAAGALVSFSLRREAWDMVVVAMVVGTSTVLIRLVAPETYTDNLLAGAVLVAALVAVVAFVREGQAALAAVLLLTGGALLHPLPFAEIVAVLGLVAVVLAPSSLRARRERGVRALSTPTGRLATVLSGSLVLAGLGFWALVRAGPDTPLLTRGELEAKLREDVPLYRYPLTAPLALLGAISLGARPAPSPTGDDRLTERLLLALAGTWAVVTVFGVLAFLAGTRVPAHRLLAFFLPLPILIGVGFLGLGRLVASRTRRFVGVAVVVAGVTGVTLIGFSELYVALPKDRGVEWLDPGKVHDAVAAANYLEAARVPETDPVVFVVDDTGPNPLSFVPEMGYMIRSVLPPARIEHSYFYVGDPERYLRGLPTYRSQPPTYNENVRRFWPTIHRLLPSRPVALLLSSFNPAYGRFTADHSQSIVVPGVAALEGPRPELPVRVSIGRYEVRSRLRTGLLGAGALLVVAVIGLGWARALLPRTARPFEVLALSPAFGIGFLLILGLLADAAGFHPGDPVALVPVLLTTVLLIVLAGLRRRSG